MKNSKSTRSNTGYKGIRFKKERGLFECAIAYRANNLNKVINIYIGSYDTLEKAIKAREEFIKSLF